jgi:hypothetical protein
VSQNTTRAPSSEIKEASYVNQHDEHRYKKEEIIITPMLLVAKPNPAKRTE